MLLNLTLLLVASILLALHFALAQDPASQSASLFRPYDGSYNNLQFPQRGAVNAPLSYVLGFQNWSNAGFPLPNARQVSMDFFQSEFTGKADFSHNLFFVFVGQLLMIDLVEIDYETATSVIDVPQCDFKFDPLCSGSVKINYKKYFTNESDDNGRPYFRNRQASYFDCSFLYGRSAADTIAQRTMKNGMLKMTSENFLPLINANTITKDRIHYIGLAPNDAKIFAAADLRINRNIGTQALTNLLAREHNRVAEDTIKNFPFMSDENVFQVARKWVISVWQNIATYRWGYYLLGEMFPRYGGYNNSVDATISTAFLSAMQAFGLTTINSYILPLNSAGEQLDIGTISIKDTIYDSSILLRIGLEGFIMGACTSPGGLFDPYISSSVVSHYKGTPVDLAAIMLQHSRQMGIPSLNDLVNNLGNNEFRSISSISQSKNIRVRLAQLYPNNASKIEGFVGMLANDPELLQFASSLTLSVVRDQLSRIMSGDRFFFQSPINNYTETEKAKIRSSSFRTIVPLTTKLSSMPPSSFGVNNIRFQNFEALSSYKFVGDTYANFTCRFSVEWKSYTDKVSFDFCLSYDSGWFALGFGDATPFRDIMIVIIEEDKITVDDLSTSNGDLWRDVIFGGRNSLNAEILEPNDHCLRKVRVTRKYLADDSFDRDIIMNPITNLTKFLWAYSSPIATTNTFTPTASGEIEGKIVLVQQQFQAVKIYPIRWSTDLIFYHGLLMFVSLFILFPLAVYTEMFCATIAGSESARNNFEGGALMLMLFSGTSAYFGVEGDFSYAHPYLGTATIFLTLFSCAYGFLCRVYWPSRGMRAHESHRRQLILHISNFSIASITFFFGLKFATEIKPGLYWMYAGFALWLVFLIIVFKFGRKLNSCVDINQENKIKRFFINRRDSFLKHFARMRTYPKFTLAQFQERVSAGSCLAIYDGKVCDLSAIFRIHPGATDAVAAHVGCDITRIFQGTFGHESSETKTKPPKSFVTISDRIFKEVKSNNSLESESHLEIEMRRIREHVFKRLSISHSGVAISQLESIIVGSLTSIALVKTDNHDISSQLEVENKGSWRPAIFPNNDNVSNPAMHTQKKTIAIFYDKKEYFEYNSFTGQSAYCFRFIFEHPRNEIWLLPGDYLELSIPDDYGNSTTMFVTPTVCHCENFININVKLYKDHKMSRLLESLLPGDLVAFRGPIPSHVPIIHREYSASGCAQQLLLLCAGSGITAGLQTMDYYLSFGPRNDDGGILSRIALVYFCRDENEIMLLDDIERLKRFSKNRIDAFYVLTKSKTWRGPSGRVSRTLLETLVMPILNIHEKHDMAFIDPDIETRLNSIENSKPEAASRRSSITGIPPFSRSLLDITDQEGVKDGAGTKSSTRASIVTSTNLFEILGKEFATYQVVICGPESFTNEAESSFEQLNIKHAKVAVLHQKN